MLRRARRTRGSFRNQSWPPVQDEYADGREETTTSSTLSKEPTLATGPAVGSTAMRWSMFRPISQRPNGPLVQLLADVFHGPADPRLDLISRISSSECLAHAAPSIGTIERMAFTETWNSRNASNGLACLSPCRLAFALSTEPARTARLLRNAWFRNSPLRSTGSSQAPVSRIGALPCWYSGVLGVPNTAARHTRKPSTAP